MLTIGELASLLYFWGEYWSVENVGVVNRDPLAMGFSSGMVGVEMGRVVLRLERASVRELLLGGEN